MNARRVSAESMAGPAVVAFLADVNALFVAAREEGRDHLDWVGWRRFFEAAVRRRIITLRQLAADADLEDVRLTSWGWAVLATARRVREAKALGKTPLEFHRDSLAAKRAQEDADRERDLAAARERSARETAKALAEREAARLARGDRRSRREMAGGE